MTLINFVRLIHIWFNFDGTLFKSWQATKIGDCFEAAAKKFEKALKGQLSVELGIFYDAREGASRRRNKPFEAAYLSHPLPNLLHRLSTDAFDRFHQAIKERRVQAVNPLVSANAFFDIFANRSGKDLTALRREVLRVVSDLHLQLGAYQDKLQPRKYGRKQYYQDLLRVFGKVISNSFDAEHVAPAPAQSALKRSRKAFVLEDSSEDADDAEEEKACAVPASGPMELVTPADDDSSDDVTLEDLVSQQPKKKKQAVSAKQHQVASSTALGLPVPSGLASPSASPSSLANTITRSSPFMGLAKPASSTAVAAVADTKPASPPHSPSRWPKRSKPLAGGFSPVKSLAKLQEAARPRNIVFVDLDSTIISGYSKGVAYWNKGVEDAVREADGFVLITHRIPTAMVYYQLLMQGMTSRDGSLRMKVNSPGTLNRFALIYEIKETLERLTQTQCFGVSTPMDRCTKQFNYHFEMHFNRFERMLTEHLNTIIGNKLVERDKFKQYLHCMVFKSHEGSGYEYEARYLEELSLMNYMSDKSAQWKIAYRALKDRFGAGTPLNMRFYDDLQRVHDALALMAGELNDGDTLQPVLVGKKALIEQPLITRPAVTAALVAAGR